MVKRWLRVWTLWRKSMPIPVSAPLASFSQPAHVCISSEIYIQANYWNIFTILLLKLLYCFCTDIGTDISDWQKKVKNTNSLHQRSRFRAKLLIICSILYMTINMINICYCLFLYHSLFIPNVLQIYDGTSAWVPHAGWQGGFRHKASCTPLWKIWLGLCLNLSIHVCLVLQRFLPIIWT